MNEYRIIQEADLGRSIFLVEGNPYKDERYTRWFGIDKEGILITNYLKKWEKLQPAVFHNKHDAQDFIKLLRDKET